MLYYREFRKDLTSPWVTFIHGAGGSSAIWYKQMKEYKKNFNILLVDLRGHGKSQKAKWKKGDTFVQIAKDVVHVLDHLNIDKSHFVGISLGTIVIQTLAQYNPERVHSMILGGAVIKLNLRTNFLLSIGNLGKYILPYMVLYRLFAWIIMPKPNHIESRLAFVDQAKKMCQKEFIKWFTLTKAINPYLKKLCVHYSNIPTLFVMGEEDYLFLPPVKQVVQQQKHFSLITLKNCGHVVNIDKPIDFNKITIQYIQDHHNVSAAL